ncbi:MAG: HTH tetR-type domain-containing protein [Oscillospiraceae bacterium]|jgi:probable dihydroxyacetone kinase regulator
MERVTPTKQLLANSLKDLMRTMPFRKITVQNVTDHCGLNRQTFYYHFKDMYELLEWIYQNEIFRHVGQTDQCDWKNAMLDLFRYARKNKAFLRNINRSLGKETIEKFLYPILCPYIKMLFVEVCPNLSIKQEDEQFLLDFFTNAFVNSIIRWIGNGMKETEEEILQKMELIKNMFFGLTFLYANPERSMSFPHQRAVNFIEQYFGYKTG